VFSYWLQSRTDSRSLRVLAREESRKACQRRGDKSHFQRPGTMLFAGRAMQTGPDGAGASALICISRVTARLSRYLMTRTHCAARAFGAPQFSILGDVKVHFGGIVWRDRADMARFHHRSAPLNGTSHRDAYRFANQISIRYRRRSR